MVDKLIEISGFHFVIIGDTDISGVSGKIDNGVLGEKSGGFEVHYPFCSHSVRVGVAVGENDAVGEFVEFVKGNGGDVFAFGMLKEGRDNASEPFLKGEGVRERCEEKKDKK